ncbi:hypothetical protein BJ170DRAFT_687327 [Xylariales sp. AK1849]|nr:hypothetical protein BJ170DRAFT_687327 [Xylariales sp. AK1849]
MRSYNSLAAVILTLNSLTRAQTSTHPPGGSGTIVVNLDGQLSPTGCLDAAGDWTVAGDCAVFAGDGTGSVSGPDGWCNLTPSSDIDCTGTSIDTAWLGIYLNGNSSAMYLEANVGAGADEPSGGLLWYAESIPAGSTTVTINGKNSQEPVHVYLSWIARA